ncbi:hypothetical protein [Candidatus Albibeggiatoa sp. nov. BB20]|uniref:hypothetical protein n=1 Tax=Candidatus Albibeggiatoa sp. nov. BB20 TaxID=3162723 RepID=UPI003365B293
MKISTTKTRTQVRPNFKNIHELAVWNPISYVILLYWILWQPKNLAEYQRLFRHDTDQRIVGWLVSHLIILPLLFTSFCLAMRWLPVSKWVWSSSAYFTITFLLGMCWLLFGKLAPKPDIQDKPFFIGLYVLIVYSCFIATLGIISGLSLSPLYSVTLIVFLAISSGIALSIANAMDLDFTALILEVIEAFADYGMKSTKKKLKKPNNIFVEILREEGIEDVLDSVQTTGTILLTAITFGAAFLIAGKLTQYIKVNLRNRTSSAITRYAFVILLINYSITWLILISSIAY